MKKLRLYSRHNVPKNVEDAWLYIRQKRDELIDSINKSYSYYDILRRELNCISFNNLPELEKEIKEKNLSDLSMNSFIDKKFENAINKAFSVSEPYKYAEYKRDKLIKSLKKSWDYHGLDKSYDKSGISFEWFKNCKTTHLNLDAEISSVCDDENWSELEKEIKEKELFGLPMVFFIDAKFEDAIHKAYSVTEPIYSYLSLQESE